MASEQAIEENKPEMLWYVLRVAVGYEKRVETSLKRMLADRGYSERFGRIMIPTEDVVEIRGGRKRQMKRKFFPGYVLLEMKMDGEVQHFLRQVPHVLGFVGAKRGVIPPLSEKEIDTVINKVKAGADKPKPKVLFEAGESVRIIDGPFMDFDAVVEHVNYEKNRLSVLVSIFGRSTPLELEFGQVEKI